MAAVEVRRVRKAYEQVADQLRELIVEGDLALGERLPNEVTLSRRFGVSRATVREALRTLAAQNLTRTTKGATGGTFVNVPSTDHISSYLSSNIGLLSHTENLSLDEFLEMRALLEIPTARLAAARHTREALAELRRAVPKRPLELDVENRFAYNRDFHSVLVAAAGNRLLTMAARPIFSVLQTHLRAEHLERDYHERINEDHRRIADAVASGDPDAAAAEMTSHLEYLRPQHERAWQTGRGAAGHPD